MQLENLSNVDKKTLRKVYKEKRKELTNKNILDGYIFENIVKLEEYVSSKTILTYVSTLKEIDTINLINYSLLKGKNVAVPYCVDKNGIMEFYYINSLDDLCLGSFDILEPKIEICKKCNDYNNSIIIVPALCYDKFGYRLGYGKGYYDRFLQNHSLISLGLCYNSNIIEKLPKDKYDKKVDFIITDKTVIKI